MEKKEYVKPYFECILLWNGEIRTADFFAASIDNDLPWNGIFSKSNQPNNNNNDIMT